MMPISFDVAAPVRTSPAYLRASLSAEFDNPWARIFKQDPSGLLLDVVRRDR
jgi:hypothetical protein